jgi:hypothetical protein
MSNEIVTPANVHNDVEDYVVVHPAASPLSRTTPVVSYLWLSSWRLPRFAGNALCRLTGDAPSLRRQCRLGHNGGIKSTVVRHFSIRFDSFLAVESKVSRISSTIRCSYRYVWLEVLISFLSKKSRTCVGEFCSVAICMTLVRMTSSISSLITLLSSSPASRIVGTL